MRRGGRRSARTARPPCRAARRARRGRRACSRCSSRAADPRPRARTRRWRRRGAPGGAASPPSSACLRGRWPTSSPRTDRDEQGYPVHPIKQGRRPERAAVDVGIAEARHRVEVIPRGVALVAIEPVARIAARAARASCGRASPWRRSTRPQSPCTGVAVHDARAAPSADRARGTRRRARSRAAAPATAPRAASPAARPGGC